MQQSEIKTIDVNCLEWFDKINGNSYFAGTVTVNYGMDNEERIYLPFQSGYGTQYEHEAKMQLVKRGYLVDNYYPLGRHCRENKIIYRSNLTENCKQKELKQIDKFIESNK